MGQRADRLPGELELLEYMRGNWRYGGTLDQLDTLFDHDGKREVSVPQLLEVLVAYGEVVEKDGTYSPAPEAALAASEQPGCGATLLETGVTEDVVERHYRCVVEHEAHEFSVLAKPGLELKANFDCLVDGCIHEAELLGDNPAEVAKDPRDLLKN